MLRSYITPDWLLHRKKFSIKRRPLFKAQRVLNKVLYGEAQVQPLNTLLKNIFVRKGTPFVFLPFTNVTPFSYLV